MTPKPNKPAHRELFTTEDELLRLEFHEPGGRQALLCSREPRKTGLCIQFIEISALREVEKERDELLKERDCSSYSNVLLKLKESGAVYEALAKVTEERDAALAEVENYKAWNDRCGKLNSGLSDTVQELTAERDRLKAELDTIESPNMVNGKREIIRLNAEVNRLRAALEHVKLYGNRSSSEIAEEALGVSE